MFSREFCEILKNTFFTEHLRTTASGLLNKFDEKIKNIFQKFFESLTDSAPKITAIMLSDKQL